MPEPTDPSFKPTRPSAIAGVIPGLVLVTIGNNIGIHQSGQLTEFVRPYVRRDLPPKLAADGSRVAAILWEPERGRTHLWSLDLATRRERVVATTLPFIGGTVSGHWSPNAQRLAAFDHEAARTELWLADANGAVEHIRFPEPIVSVAWRDDREVTVATAQPASVPWPVSDVSIWRVRGAASVERSAKASALFGPYLAWSNDGARLAVVGEHRKISALEQVLPTADLLLERSDLSATGQGCALAGREVTFFDPHWDPGGRAIAVIGNGPGQSNWFVAGSTERRIRAFGAPAACYVGSATWTKGRLFVSLFGPSCGGNDRENRLVLLDPETFTVRGEFVIPRKGTVIPNEEGSAFVTRSDAALDYTRIDNATTVSIPLPPLARLVAWCCR